MTPSDRCRVGFLWTPILETFDFGAKHSIKVGRFQMVRDFLSENDFLDQSNVEVLTPEYLSSHRKIPILQSVISSIVSPLGN